MKKEKYLIVFIMLLSIGSLFAEKNNIPIKSIRSLNTDDVLSKDILTLFEEESYYERLLTYNIKTDNKIKMYKMSSKYKPIYLADIPANTKLRILAETQKSDFYNNEKYFLVKITGENKLWSGWIEGNKITLPDEEKDKKFMLYSRMINISENNHIISTHTGWNGKYVVADQSGSYIYEIPQKELKKHVDVAVDGSFMDWSSDQNKIWFYSNMDSIKVLFGVINIKERTYNLLKAPKNYASYQMEIDYNNGDIIYSNYPYQFDIETAQETNNSGKIFHLYKSNIFTNKVIIIDKNVGEGFKIFKNNNGNIEYEKSNNY